MPHLAQNTALPHYSFRLAYPQRQLIAIFIASTPALAVAAFGHWFAVPVEQVAITRRTPVGGRLS